MFDAFKHVHYKFENGDGTGYRAWDQRADLVGVWYVLSDVSVYEHVAWISISDNILTRVLSS